MGRSFGWDRKKTEVPCYSKYGTIKISLCSKDMSAQHRPKFCSASPVMVASLYKFIIIEWDVKQLIINQSFNTKLNVFKWMKNYHGEQYQRLYVPECFYSPVAKYFGTFLKKKRIGIELYYKIDELMSKQRIISLMHSFILRRICFHSMIPRFFPASIYNPPTSPHW
jgi:hypothetical protein